ncbi:MAG: hypothetical protein ACE5JZ_10295 [Kiloniellales bacterium]
MSHGAGHLAAWGAALAAAALMVAAALAAEGYDKEFRNHFIRTCITGGGTYTACQCTLLQIESQIKFDAFTQMRTAVRGGGQADQATLDLYEKIVTDCVAREQQ